MCRRGSNVCSWYEQEIQMDLLPFFPRRSCQQESASKVATEYLADFPPRLYGLNKKGFYGLRGKSRTAGIFSTVTHLD